MVELFLESRIIYWDLAHSLLIIQGRLNLKKKIITIREKNND